MAFAPKIGKKAMEYGVLQGYGLWVENPRIPTRELENPMGYSRVWVVRGMG
jgi:hypothetical protein